MTTTSKITRLRQRMLDDMNARNLGRHSQRSHIYSCKRFAACLGRSPDTATADDVRQFQLHLIESGCSIGNRNRIMSAEGIKRLIDCAPGPGLKYEAALSVAYGAGLRASEMVSLQVGDIDSSRMLIRVAQGKGKKDRYVMLSPSLLELLRDWWRQARPAQPG
jgi:integrase/recombinase XerD